MHVASQVVRTELKECAGICGIVKERFYDLLPFLISCFVPSPRNLRKFNKIPQKNLVIIGMLP